MPNLDSERQKYEQIYSMGLWKDELEPGMQLIDFFLSYVGPFKSITDFGCGSGEAGLVFHGLGYHVNLVDITDNCLRKSVKMVLGQRFISCPLHEVPASLPLSDWGYCTDVMEHIPEQLVRPSLQALWSKTHNMFFSISGRPDHDGVMIGETLHMTVKPIDYWLTEINKLWHHIKYAIGSPNLYIIMGRD